jgi:predicted nucleic acid-binding protein
VIVVDASIALDVALATSDGRVLQARIETDGRPLAAPELIDLEVLQALRRQLRLGRFDPGRAKTALGIFGELSIERFSHLPLRPRIWALRDNLTSYDGAYFALAEVLDAPLWTRDGKYMSVPGHAARIEVL